MESENLMINSNGKSITHFLSDAELFNFHSSCKEFKTPTIKFNLSSKLLLCYCLNSLL